MGNRLKTLRIIHLAIAAGPAVFLFIVYFLGPLNRSTEPLSTIAIVLGVLMAAFGLFVINLFAKKASSMDDAGKMSLYFSTKIIQWAVFEGGAFLNAVVFYMSGLYVNAAVAVLLIILLLARPPKRDELTNSFNYRGGVEMQE